MWNRINLRTRIYVILTSLILMTLAGGVVTVWYTYQMQRLLEDITGKNLAALRAAEELEIALVNQKGFVSYFFLDGNTEWLERLGEYRQRFRDRLHEARQLIQDSQQMEALERIESEYLSYVSLKDQVITYYRAGSRDEGTVLHQKVRHYFFNILELTEAFRNTQKEKINIIKEGSQKQAKKLRVIAATAVIAVLLLGVFLTFILTAQILGPVRRLALKTDPEALPNIPEDEVKALSRGVRGLMENIDHSHSQLERSQEILLQAEKMAMVGKLAAGTAHSIRNPLTSLKMRLFSLSRSLELTADQKEDFEVITDEIGHIDNIVENFLEFSRPPKLKVRCIHSSDVIEMTLNLLHHRVASYDVSIKFEKKGDIPAIQADPEQLKEVLVNIVVNACEAMPRGGSIVISEDESLSDSIGKVVEIRVSDDGPGLSDSIKEKIFQPFFTTKEEGTGLGLSIANRIVEQHGGLLDFESEEGKGTTFIIRIPVAEGQV
ncbi:Integral membrane sensor signal transduction histidine kinase [uncultured Desulfobacterium sp.]|uniref:histidine kinase n=1 Tax=uncultured Desulfobacterium sp. TaxID=201089 RepID=A0A445MYM5_9BACT|nr:Integral membrane sensor signal transduction histidine kinase [uncultured Desulfobacterium sp.]